MRHNKRKTYRQARPPPRNVILRISASAQDASKASRSHIRVDTRHARLNESLGKGGQPPLRFPFVSVLAPNRFIPISRIDADNDVGALRNEDIVNHLAVHAPDGIHQGED